MDWVEDLDTRVDIAPTAAKDVKGLLRVRSQRARRASKHRTRVREVVRRAHLTRNAVFNEGARRVRGAATPTGSNRTHLPYFDGSRGRGRASGDSERLLDVTKAQVRSEHTLRVASSTAATPSGRAGPGQTLVRGGVWRSATRPHKLLFERASRCFAFVLVRLRLLQPLLRTTL